MSEENTPVAVEAEVVRYEKPAQEFIPQGEDERMAYHMVKSGMFRDTRVVSQAVVKLTFGRALGLDAYSSMVGLYVSQQGKLCMTANLMAAVIRRSGAREGGYDYEIKEHTDKVCRIEYFRRVRGAWKSMGEVKTTIDQFKHLAVGANKANWTNYPQNMLFARNITNGQKFHCLAGDTPVLTRGHGVIPIKQAVGKQILLNSKSQWVDAEVRHFGFQKLLTLKFRYKGTVFTVRATPEHRWKLTDGRVVLSSALTKRDWVRFTCATRQVVNQERYCKGVVHGLVYGDGTQVASTGYTINLYEDAADLLPYLKEFSVTYPASLGGAPHVGIGKGVIKNNLKELPLDPSDHDYMVGFFRGWFAADGTIDASHGSSICVGLDEEMWLRRYMPIHGYEFGNSNAQTPVTNFGPRIKASRRLGIVRACLKQDDFLIGRKAARFEDSPALMDYWFVGFEDGVAEEEVFCAVVPDTHDFVLGRGLLTGNCPDAFGGAAVYLPDELPSSGLEVDGATLEVLPRPASPPTTSSRSQEMYAAMAQQGVGSEWLASAVGTDSPDEAGCVRALSLLKVRAQMSPKGGAA